ncbi:APC family permease [Sporomusa acidovorans]|uniref:Potassium transporter KimA n=1 Tax=Sporomusa acidovorans (strain ATCC 49682 / DSM 3132 / Mol) TaxID=1123286 RepID=A0ABZ3J6B0_SPOA4|nr:APC family permease [Sporomusa acidovorans]OZC15374.1 Low affinity potassium transport system protein kup [Sporomusa acidovorans DSM 3132]SDF13936.1 amino acid/polyamine/organocation transporter, APC superfamily [Sporomusa acidovorans]
MYRQLRKLFIGRPLHNRELTAEHLPKWKALSIFSSDALSSVGYGPEQIAITLAVPGLLLYGYIGYVAAAILVLLAIVTISYVQVSRANPGGGGSYAVAKNNIGEFPALVAAAALFADYTLTVAVSVSSGTEALISAFPDLLHAEVTIDLFVLFTILMLVNLRGVRESSNVFVFPTYFFVISMFILILTGAYQAFTGTAPVIPAESTTKQPFDWLVIVLLLRAFASGCSSMTGVEAISNGVPMFKQPQAENAIKTTFLMAGMLAVMLAGTTFLILHNHILPQENVTMLSRLAEETFGRGWMYYFLQLATMLVLYLAANTSYNGLPLLLSILARDGYMPRYLGIRGERLSFSNGIILLSLSAGALIAGFGGNVEHLISLYAIGVFLSFTIAQTALVIHWRREKGPSWKLRAIINACGAVITGIVVLIIAISKFFLGAWIVLLFIPAMIYIFKAIKQHYTDMAEQLHLSFAEWEALQQGPPGKNIIVVPVSSPTSVVVQTMRYAHSISMNVIALHVTTDRELGRKVEEKWKIWDPGVRLITVYSPYRLVIQPVIHFIEKLQKNKAPEDFITVLIPEFETRKWWHRFLHNQTGLILRTLLILKEDVVVATIPYHLKR